MAAPVINCEFCGQPVDVNSPGNYRKVVGWSQTRKQGGANSLLLASDPLAWAHAWCMDVIKKRGFISQNESPLF